ncbi:MAG: prepilin-type N-terminal cleavage/methylation domain-containing protein [Sedimentisphaerales bacterium]|nr:prepilin-type N-terminal cleavage/methylation domain-containing protein [Sedimentisphaerales bacterium]
MNTQRGFTLIEVLMAVIIIGLAIAGLVGANRAYTMANGTGWDLTRSEFLIEQIRELTMTLPVADPQSGQITFGPESGETLASYDDLDDLDGCLFDPPIDARRNRLTYMAGLGQMITVCNVDPKDLDKIVADHGSDFVRITVQIIKAGKVIDSCTWLRTRY